MNFSQRLSLLHALCLNENMGGAAISPNLQDYDPRDAANFLACYITFKAIQQAERSPGDERIENFDMLSVYQTYAMLVYAYLMMPLSTEDILPDLEGSPIVIAKTLFAGLENEELADIIESGTNKFELIAGAEQEHWTNFRQDMDKAVIAFVISGTDDNTPFEKEEVIPVLGAFLSMLCEAFTA